MKTRLTISILAVLALTAVAFAQPAGGKGQGGPDRGQRRGMMGTAMFVEQSWAALCFEIDLSSTQIAKLKPSYVWAYRARAAAMKTAREQQSFEAAGTTMTYIKTTLEARIPNVLTAAQKTAWQKWQANQAAMRNRARQGGGGGKAGDHK
jgi:Spy/CpxP family protein refolding chaperone